MRAVQLVPPARMRRLLKLSPEEKAALIAKMGPADVLMLDADFEAWCHKGQIPPPAEGWRTWLMIAGRGYGKTRAGAEWITRLATQRGRSVRIALVGATEGDARAVMVEGESGLLSVGRRHGCQPRWEPSRGRLCWPGGSEAQVYSAAEPDGLRGPNHHYAWCDELAKWARAEEAWDNLRLTLRLGERPRALVTTTPRPVPILGKIQALRGTVESGGATGDNISLPPDFVQAMVETYGGTRIGRQELDGKLLVDVEGTLWPRDLIERCRGEMPLPSLDGKGPFGRIVIGVDPPITAGGDACGIVAVGLAWDGVAHVIGDHSMSGLSPEGWAGRVAAAYEAHGADLVIAEANQGGEMVESVLRGASLNLPVRLVHATRGKVVRAEPVAILFERGRARFAGAFPELEDELAGMKAGGGYGPPGRSPDRADAMIWAMTELMLGRAKGEPRVVAL